MNFSFVRSFRVASSLCVGSHDCETFAYCSFWFINSSFRWSLAPHTTRLTILKGFRHFLFRVLRSGTFLWLSVTSRVIFNIKLTFWIWRLQVCVSHLLIVLRRVFLFDILLSYLRIVLLVILIQCHCVSILLGWRLCALKFTALLIEAELIGVII